MMRKQPNMWRIHFLHVSLERKDPGSGTSFHLLHHPSGDHWVQANEQLVEKNQYRVKGLPVGEKMLFRVVAVNIAGRSPPATLAQGVTIREIVGQTRVPNTLL